MCPSTEVAGTRGVWAQRIWKRSCPQRLAMRASAVPEPASSSLTPSTSLSASRRLLNDGPISLISSSKPFSGSMRQNSQREGVHVGCAEDAVAQGVALFRRAGMIGREALPEVFVQRADAGFEFFERPGGELAVVFAVGLDAVEHRRLDVGDDEPVEIVENAAFNDVDADAALLFVAHAGGVLLPEKKGCDHLVRLLVQLEKFHGTQLVVPPPHAGSRENELEKAFSDAPHGHSSLA